MPFLTCDCSHLEGENRTSFGSLFPGCPGLSQSWFRRFFQTAALRLFYQGTIRNMENLQEKVTLLFFTSCSPKTACG